MSQFRSSLTAGGLLLLAFMIVQCSSSRKGSSRRDADGKPGADRLRREVVDFALKQEGAPYRYAGRSPRTGFDCSGFTHYVMSEFGVDLPPVSRSQEDMGQKISVRETRPGDLIFFRRSKNGRVFHVSLVVSNDRGGITVVHSTSRGVTVDNISESSYWKSKISTARRVLD